MAEIKLTGFKNGRQSTVGDTDTAMIDGSLTIGDDLNEDAVVFNAEINSDFIPDVDNSFDIGSPSKTWSQLYVQEASFDDVLLTELSIPGVQLQTDTNAYRFNCPYALEITGLRLNLDQHGTSGTVTVTVASGGTTMITLNITGTSTSATTTSVTSGNRSQGDVVTFAITSVGTSTTNTNGLRAALEFRRTLS